MCCLFPVSVFISLSVLVVSVCDYVSASLSLSLSLSTSLSLSLSLFLHHVVSLASGPVAPAIELQSRWVARVFSRRASLPVSVTARLREMRQRRARDVASMGYGYLLRPHDAGGWEVTPSDDPGIEALGRKIFPLMEYQVF